MTGQGSGRWPLDGARLRLCFSAKVLATSSADDGVPVDASYEGGASSSSAAASSRAHSARSVSSSSSLLESESSLVEGDFLSSPKTCDLESDEVCRETPRVPPELSPTSSDCCCESDGDDAVLCLAAFFSLWSAMASDASPMPELTPLTSLLIIGMLMETSTQVRGIYLSVRFCSDESKKEMVRG